MVEDVCVIMGKSSICMQLCLHLGDVVQLVQEKKTSLSRDLPRRHSHIDVSGTHHHPTDTFLVFWIFGPNHIWVG